MPRYNLSKDFYGYRETVKERGVGIAIMDRIHRAQTIEKDNLNE